MSEPTSNTDSPLASFPGFEMERPLAEGGMAKVYLAKQVSLDRMVALKVLRAFNDPDQRERFFNESRTIAGLNHRNIITIHDVGETEGRAFLSMAYLEGGDLATRLAAGPIDPCDALEIAASICEALAHAHAHGVVHRDVKPANILFHKDGTPVLTDFGIATNQKLERQLTACDTTIGTPCYVSPEQVQCSTIDGRSDLYSLGVVLYEMLVGEPPIREASAVETMAAHVNTPPNALPEPLQDFKPLLDRMLAKCPSERFQDAAELVDTLRTFQLDYGSTAFQPETRLDELRKVTRKLNTWARPYLQRRDVALAGAGLLLVAVFWTSIIALREPDPIDNYLAQAERAFDEDRLAYPVAESAYFYFREVLRLDPENEDALAGLHDIAEAYADRAEADLIDSNFPSAKFHIDRGLDAEPGNDRLLDLRRDTGKLRRLPQKVVSGIKSIFR